MTYLIVNHENAYSKACEINGEPDGSLSKIAAHDFAILKSLFDFPLGEIGDLFEADVLLSIGNYKASQREGSAYNTVIRDKIQELSKELARAKSAVAFQKAVSSFYAQYGVGKLGLHKAFRIERIENEYENEVLIKPINNVLPVSLDDLVGYEDAKRQLIINTEAFLNGKPSNNCLLYGEAGTGKSSSIKAIMNRYYDRGLRLIEVYKHQFRDLNDVISQIKNRNYRFIIYMDDLSFEDFEIEYKYLKAVIEGGLEKKPDNILIYATSNRRHLVREKFSDRSDYDADVHTSETMEEKTSLVSRFGMQIYFGSPTPKDYDAISLALAQRAGLDITDRDAFLQQARQWEIMHGGYSGRTAQQFVDYLCGQS